MAKASRISRGVVDVPPMPESSDMQHCVQFTREQYSALCELCKDPLFKKAVLVPASYPSWEELMSDSEQQRKGRGFTWIVYHYWLGSLKFALQSKGVEDGEKLYDDIFTIYEELLSQVDNDPFVVCPPRKRCLMFGHLGQGLFHLKLAMYDTGEARPQGVTRSRTTEECRRRVRLLAAEAMHVTRGSPWPKSCRNLYDHVAGLPCSVLDTDGVEFSPNSLDQVSIGPESAAYRHELRRSVAYIAEQMERKGDHVDWESLYVGAIATDESKQHDLLSAISESVYDFIRSCGQELLHTPSVDH